jgi:hypothetical protein
MANTAGLPEGAGAMTGATFVGFISPLVIMGRHILENLSAVLDEAAVAMMSSNSSDVLSKQYLQHISILLSRFIYNDSCNAFKLPICKLLFPHILQVHGIYGIFESLQCIKGTEYLGAFAEIHGRML